MLEFKEPGDDGISDSRAPIIVCDQVEQPLSVSIDDVAAFCSYPVFHKLTESTVFSDDAAELLFEAFASKRRLWAKRIEYHDGSGIEFVEIWAAEFDGA